jgi:hypothetical protein
MSTLLKTNLTPSKEKEKGEEMSHMMVWSSLTGPCRWNFHYLLLQQLETQETSCTT